LVHPGRPPVAGRDNDYSVRLFYGEWYKRGSVRPGGDIPGDPTDTLATREEIMMALGNVDNLLIRRVIPALPDPVARPNDFTYTSPFALER
jgi:hypothetical protein